MCKYALFFYTVDAILIKIVHKIAPTVPIAYPKTANKTPTVAKDG